MSLSLDIQLFNDCYDGKLDSVKYILLKNRTVDVNWTNQNGATPLHVACQNGHKEIIPLLLEKGAKIDAPKQDGTTPLFIACQQGHKEIIPLLLEKGAKIDAPRQNGATPLYIACQNGHKEIISLLLEKGAKIDAPRQDDGSTPLSITEKKWPDIAVMMKIHRQTSSVLTPKISPPSPNLSIQEIPKVSSTSKTEGRFVTFDEISSPTPLSTHLIYSPEEVIVSLEEALQIALVDNQRSLEILQSTVIPYGEEKYYSVDTHLTKEEYLSIYLYTSEVKEDSLYKILNKSLTNPDRQTLFKWRPFLFHFFNAFKKIEKHPPLTVYRGVSLDVVSLNQKKYQKGNKITWFAWTSTTMTLEAIQSFLDPNNSVTIFCIENCFSGRSISSISAIQREEEILLPPGSRFEIKSVLKLNPTTNMIQMVQIPTLEKSLGFE